MFNDTSRNIEKLFSTTSWKNNNIKTYPSNYQGKIGGKEWIRVNIFQGTSTFRYGGDQAVGGQLVCNIFVPAGKGLKRANEIADILHDYISTSTISGVQTTNSFLTTVGVDSADSGLFRIDYTINFNNYN